MREFAGMFTVRWTKGDKILVAALLVITLAFIAQIDLSSRQGDWAVIEVDQKVVRRVPLARNQVISVEGRLGVTQVEIHDGRARIHSSPCQNKICVKSGFIQYADRLTACIPNRVVVKILGNSRRGVDAVIG